MLQKLLQWFRMKARKQGEKEERFFSDCFNRSKEAIDRGQSVLGAITPALGKQERFGWSNSEIAGILSSPYIAGVSTVCSFRYLTDSLEPTNLLDLRHVDPLTHSFVSRYF